MVYLVALSSTLLRYQQIKGTAEGPGDRPTFWDADFALDCYRYLPPEHYVRTVVVCLETAIPSEATGCPRSSNSYRVSLDTSVTTQLAYISWILSAVADSTFSDPNSTHAKIARVLSEIRCTRKDFNSSEPT